MNKDQLLDELRNFYGTEHYYRHMPGLIITDGVKFLADEAGAYWLLDVVWSHMSSIPKSEGFAIVTLKKSGRSAVFQMQDDDPPESVYAKQDIGFTDFPLDEIKMYLIRDESGFVLLLQTEY